jgi:hypothetical protein
MHGREEKCIHNFGRIILREENSEDLGVNGKHNIILVFREIGWEGVVSSDLG